MQLRDIVYVLAVADEGNFSKAALKVHVSQPALSQLIQRLEDELGVKLFIRKSNRVILTNAGKIFYEDGKEILKRSDKLIEKMRDFRSLKEGELTIAIAPFYQRYYLLEILEKFQQKHCGIKIKLVDAFSQDSELLLQGKVDLAFVILPYDNKGIKYEALIKEGIYLAVPKKFEINRLLPAPNERALTGDDLQILFEQSFIMYQRGRRMYKTSIELCNCAGFSPRIAFETNSCEGLNAMVARGMGIGFIPEAIDRTGALREQINYYPIAEETAFRTLTIGYLEKNITREAREFIRLLLPAMEKGTLVQEGEDLQCT